MRYKLICFDAGFTLIKPRRSPIAVVATILADAGITPSEEALRAAWNVAERRFMEDYHRPDNDTWTSDEQIDAMWRRHYGSILRDLVADDPEQRLVRAVLDSYWHSENWELYPDVLPALEELQAAGLALAVISDWTSQLPEILAAVGLARFFQAVLVSASAGAAKPAARFYQLAAQTIGVSPEEALMVGDSYKADVLGARAAGMAAILLDRQGAGTFDDVTSIRSLRDLPALVLA